MKKIFLTIFAISVCSFAFAQPQGSGSDPALTGSVEGNSYSNSPMTTPRLGGSLGIEWNNNEKVSYLTQVKYSSLKSSTNESYSFLRLPLAVKYNPFNPKTQYDTKIFVHFYGGFELSYLLSAKDANGRVLNLSSSQNLKRISYGPVAGFEIGGPNRGPHFGTSLTRRYNTDAKDTDGHFSIDFYVRIKFGSKDRKTNSRPNLMTKEKR